MRPTLAPRNRVDLIDDDGARRVKHPSSANARQHDVERFRSGDEDVRRLSQHLRARGSGGVSRSNRHPDLGERFSLQLEASSQLGERNLEIPLNVVVERLERRDVEKMNAVPERLLQSLDNERVQLPEKRGQSLSRSGRRKDQRVASTRNRRPTLTLRLARLTQSLGEPFANERMEPAIHLPLQNSPQLLRAPLEDLSRPRSFSELFELDLLRV